MQQAATRTQRAPSSAVEGNTPPAAPADAFVINLVSSTTPVALSRPDHAGLRRFTFFVSRRREQDGRERFRLHMGYFETQEEAEKLLDIVREIYPGAWAGLAPGRSLRASAAAATAALGAAATSAPRPVPAATPASTSPRVGVIDAIPAAATPTSTQGSARPARAGVPAPTAAAAPAAARKVTAVLVARPHESNAKVASRQSGERQAAVHSLSSVRDAIAALGDKGRAPSAPRSGPSHAAAPSAASIPTCQPAFPQPVASERTPAPTPVGVSAAARGSSPVVVPPRIAAPATPSRSPALSEREVLKVLEGPAHAVATSAPSKSRAPAAADQKPCYAVQLTWSVEPIDLGRVPQLAIFSAYTLYGAQGHREGRRWYGLRLGFFTDVVSAKQVAQYVRADFATVSVVPVTARERDQAKRALAGAAAAPAAATGAAAASAAAASLDEFKFIDDTASEPIKTLAPPRPAAAQTPASRAKRGPGKRVGVRGAVTRGANTVRGAAQIQAHRKAKPMTLEETLEILGANDLEVDAVPGGSIDDAGMSHARLEPVKGKASKLSRLFDRLSERLA